jgi:hypothetical protein
VWSAPLEAPVAPLNSAFVLLYSRYLHTTAGARDEGAPVPVIAGAMRYARELYALGGRSERLLFLTDDGDHNYGRTRREHTYRWFARTLLRRPAEGLSERELAPQPADALEPDIGGTRSLAEELSRRALAEREHRFLAGRPTSVALSQARRAASEIFDARAVTLRPELVWSGAFAGRKARAFRYRGEAYDVPVIEIEGGGWSRSGSLLYLPGDGGVAGELSAIQERARRYAKVVAVDYLGVGELASDRLLLHSFARALMYADQSLPQANVALLRGVLARVETDVEIEGAGWAPSLYAAILRALEPARVRRVHLSGVPPDELEWLGAGQRVPDLLLHPILFARLTVAELS